jgi:thiamine transporter
MAEIRTSGVPFYLIRVMPAEGVLKDAVTFYACFCIKTGVFLVFMDYLWRCFTMRNTRTRTLVEGALMIALATILSYWKLLNMPQGGAITLEMIPLVIMGVRNGPKWGCFTGFVHGLLQMVMGFENVLYCQTLVAQVGCILLDYLLAFTVLGLADVFAKPFGDKPGLGVIVGTVVVGLLRFACSFLSGWLLWGSYAWEGWPAWAYSLAYNGAYMVPDIIIMAVVIGLLYRFAPTLLSKQK